MKNCKIMNSTLFSIKGGGNGCQGAKPVYWVERLCFQSTHSQPTLLALPSEGALKEEWRGCWGGSAVGPALGQGFQLERRGEKWEEPCLSPEVISCKVRAGIVVVSIGMCCICHCRLSVLWRVGSMKLIAQFPTLEVHVAPYASLCGEHFLASFSLLALVFA